MQVYKNKNSNLRFKKGKTEDKKDFPFGNAVSLKLCYHFYESLLREVSLSIFPCLLISQ